MTVLAGAFVRVALYLATLMGMTPMEGIYIGGHVFGQYVAWMMGE